MIVVRENKKKDSCESFPIAIKFNTGELYFTERAAKELRDKLSSILSIMKQKRENEELADKKMEVKG